MAAVTIFSDFGAQGINSLTISIVSSSICHEVMGPDAMILAFWMLSFKSVFFVLLFHFHQEALKFLFTFFRKGGVICVLESLTFLPATLIPTCTSSSLAFCMIYFAYKLNKQGDNIQPWRTPFLIWNQSVVSCIMWVSSPGLHWPVASLGGAMPSVPEWGKLSAVGCVC